MTPFLARRQRFDLVASTNDVVRGWLADGTPEVCLAIADEQSSGRGRMGRTWVAPNGWALLLSLGFRPAWLEPERTWRLAAITAMAMAEAGEEVAGLPDRSIRLKWPNDLVVERDEPGSGAAQPAVGSDDSVRKLAGLLGESDGLGTADPRVVVGLGINVDWAATDFPPDLAGAMTSLRVASGGQPVDREGVLDTFIGRVEARATALRDGRFDGADWQDRQLTTGRVIHLERSGMMETVRALGVDAATGALLVEDASAPGGARSVFVGEISHVRLASAAGAVV